MIRNISVFDSYLSKQIYQNNMKLIQFKGTAIPTTKKISNLKISVHFRSPPPPPPPPSAMTRHTCRSKKVVA